MVFGADSRLVPSREADQDFNGSGNFHAGLAGATNNSYGRMMNNGQIGGLVHRQGSADYSAGAGTKLTQNFGAIDLAASGDNVLQATHSIEQGKNQLKEIINVL